MEQQPPDKKSEEIAEAARRYLMNRWQRTAAIWLLILPNLLAVLAGALLIRFLIPALFGLISPYGPPERTPWLLVALLLVGLGLYAIFFEKLHRQLLRLRQPPPAVVAPRDYRPDRYPWLNTLGIVLAAASMLLWIHVCRTMAPRGQMFGLMLWFTALMAVNSIVRWINKGAWSHVYFFSLLSAGAVTLWTLAVYLGFPAPAFLLVPQAILSRAFLPLGLFFVLWALLSGLYGNLQFRRLQRLVSEVPPEGSDGTD